MRHLHPLYQRGLFIGLALAALIVLFVYDPSRSSFIPRCPFRLLTGYECPGCGLQRAIHALLHGRWPEAWRYNRFLIYALPWLGSVIVTEWFLRGERQAYWRRIVEGKVAIFAYLILFLAWGIIRNIWNM